VFTKKIHVFKAGDQTSAQGVQRKFTPKELKQVVDNYDPSIHEAPLVLGHQGDNDSLPSFGWIKGFQSDGQNLFAEVAFTDVAKDLVKDGHYRKVSISFYSPDSQINPHKGEWSARHLALLGASPPAVKGLEPFSFAEWGDCYDFAVALSPADLFDDELGPTMIVDKSPLEMLKEKLEEVRKDVTSAVSDLQDSQQDQKTQQTDEVAASGGSSDDASPDNPSQQFAERKREGTEIAQQTAELEDNLPEDQFMEDKNISRKRTPGANGQVMQVVENIYKEPRKERKVNADRSEEAKRQIKEGKFGKAHETEELEKDEDAKESQEYSRFPENMSDDHKELHPNQRILDKNHNNKIDSEDMHLLRKHGADKKGEHPADHSEHDFDEVSVKTNPSPGVVKFGKKSEPDDDDDTGRFETARSTKNGYEDRMQTGKSGDGSDTGRFKTAKSSAQDVNRMQTAMNGEQDADRVKTAKEAEMAEDGPERWAGQSDSYERVNNMDQYDVDAKSYGVNAPKTASGANPAGREDSATKFPTETEETPDNEVFAVSTINVMSDGSMRVLRQKSSDGRKAVKGGAIDHAEPEAAEVTGPMGVSTHAEGDDEDEPGNIKQGKVKLNKGQLVPGEYEGGVAQVVGPDGAFAEVPSGEKKATSKQLTPGAMDAVDEADQTVGPDGAFAEDNLSGTFQGGPNQTTKKSGGVFAEEHGEKKPYTKTGFGSTYDEDGGDDEGGDSDADFNELSTDHCGMNYTGMGSSGQARSVGFPEQMYEELQSLKNKYAELERKHAEEKMKARREKMAGAIGHLYTEGRLTDGIMPEQELISYCEGLEFGTLEFSEGETPATKLLGLLSKLPPMVSYGEVVQGGTFQFAEEDLDPHAKALRMVESSEGKLDYVEALKKAMYS